MHSVVAFGMLISLFIGISTFLDTVSALTQLKCPLHECIFNGDRTKLIELLKSDNVNLHEKDKHGNTALHLAVMMSKREFIDLLLEHNAPVNINNLSGWTPLSEAISYGDRELIRLLWLKSKKENEDKLNEKRPEVLKTLELMDDFYLELKWNFSSWLRFLTWNFPSDLCKIRKRGSSVRFDSTIAHFNGLNWKRGDVTFLFDSQAPSDESLFILDNKGRVYQKLGREQTEEEIDNEVDKLMTNELTFMELDTGSAKCSRAKSGFFFASKDKREMVGSYEADYYVVDGMILNTRNRREHLSEKDIRKNEKIEESLNKGYWPKTESQSDSRGSENRSRSTSFARTSQSHENRSRWSLSRGSRENRSRWSLSRESREKKIQPIMHKTSLLPPPPSSVDWETYINSDPGRHPSLGRPVILKESRKNYKATIAMSSMFPLSVEKLMKVLEVIDPLEPKQMTNLKEFLQMKLPSGFPIKLDIPVFPLVAANVTFQKFKVEQDADETLFRVPSDYKLDPTRFPDL